MPPATSSPQEPRHNPDDFAGAVVDRMGMGACMPPRHEYARPARRTPGGWNVCVWWSGRGAMGGTGVLYVRTSPLWKFLGKTSRKLYALPTIFSLFFLTTQGIRQEVHKDYPNVFVWSYHWVHFLRNQGPFCRICAKTLSKRSVASSLRSGTAA